jgi:hypothetical protein
MPRDEVREGDTPDIVGAGRDQAAQAGFMRRHTLTADALRQRGVMSGGREARRSRVTKAAIGQPTRVKRLPPHMTARYARVVDMAKKNPALFIPVKVG